ncbi:hypothetical protein MPH_05931 [Macrophomina phaseolina MS6]|uniref:Uncharacterized protein n=1 Tax=Macrophomina phaseolina (strain MS6) TaxID=1126212 RepID=K2S2T5_MACPH|nr:hypothetical protein MPH_05931 [Macrophomina phaseolina MS6]
MLFQSMASKEPNAQPCRFPGPRMCEILVSYATSALVTSHRCDHAETTSRSITAFTTQQQSPQSKCHVHLASHDSFRRTLFGVNSERLPSQELFDMHTSRPHAEGKPPAPSQTHLVPVDGESRTERGARAHRSDPLPRRGCPGPARQRHLMAITPFSPSSLPCPLRPGHAAGACPPLSARGPLSRALTVPTPIARPASLRSDGQTGVRGCMRFLQTGNLRWQSMRVAASFEAIMALAAAWVGRRRRAMRADVAAFTNSTNLEQKHPPTQHSNDPAM